jgi:sec-independent protein translocase protein TatC
MHWHHLIDLLCSELVPACAQKFLFPEKEELPENIEMPIWDHLEELRERVLVSGLACAAAILTCFVFSKVGC